MKQVHSFLKHLKAFDLVVVVFFILLTITNIIFRNRVEEWLFFVFMNTGIILFAFLIAFLENKSNARIWRIIHYWYIAPLILVTFKELYFMIRPIRPVDYDQLFIQIDRWMFGTDPTHFLYQFSHPVITEILQIVYGSFYLLPILLGLFLLKNKRYLATDFAVFSVIYGFYLSYLGYFALPGIGPRFTLHNFETINEELPGLFLTNSLREIVNTGESIPAGTPNPAEVVQRDVFPSGHTMITLIVMYLSWKLRSRSRYFFLIVGSLLILATVYLWYHYVIDLIGGLIFMIFSVWSGKHIFNWWRRKIGKEEFEYEKA
jgi:membrane-associated phospholipid phosphatase